MTLHERLDSAGDRGYSGGIKYASRVTAHDDPR